jgi:hypothetical protein
MNNCNNDEPRLDENPEPWRSQTSGRVTASADWKCRDTLMALITTGRDSYSMKGCNHTFRFTGIDS